MTSKLSAYLNWILVTIVTLNEYSDNETYYVTISKINNAKPLGVFIHWTGLLEWNTGLDYWNDFFVKFLSD